MNHLLEISQLSQVEVQTLIQRAMFFKHNIVFPDFSHLALATLFYENSTRTRISFELAAKHLGMKTIHVDVQHSSESKGEIIEDTIQTLHAMGISLFVIRHSKEGLPSQLIKTLPATSHIINAGDGKAAHPSQALLDFMTIFEHKTNLAHLKIAIVGDIKHSRVANSLQQICSLFQVELVLVAPPLWQPDIQYYGRVSDSLIDGLTDADVVISLRVQKERLASSEHLDLADYRRNYAVTQKAMNYAKKDAILMHPGPINRGIELDDEVAFGPQSCILQQVSNGVFMRMAILEALGQSA